MKSPFITLAAISLSCMTSPAALLLHYTFDEGSGTTVGDSSGNGRDLTLSGSSWNASGQFGGSVNLGNALARTGGASSATITSLNGVTGNQVSIAFWANINSESIGSNVFTISDSNTTAGNRIISSHLEWTDGTTYFDATWGDGTNNRASGNIGLVADARHHYVYTFDSSTGAMSLYKDNVEVISASTAVSAAIDWAGIQNFELGAQSFVSGAWGGEMDDFAMWNHVLTEQERTTAFTQGVAAIPEPSSSLLVGIGGLSLLLRRRR